MIEPTIFLGPPGTGKTTTLLDTVDMEMENGVPPDKIGFMTFTKRGVEEAVSRASARFKRPRKDFRYFNTLHSAAFRHLGIRSSDVFTGKRVQEFGESFGFEVRGSMSPIDGTFSSFWGDDLILFLENMARITLVPFGQILSLYDYAVPDSDRAWRIAKAMWDFKKEQGLYDFTDMIEEFIKLDDPPRLDVLIVDEGQDLSELQWQMVMLLSRHVKRMYIAGDDDQTIFTWAGASERFITMPGKVQILKQSHRVPISVYGLANRMINKVQNRRSKDWLPRDTPGTITPAEGISVIDPSAFRSNGSVMMLGRTVKMLRQKFIPYCRHHGLPYRYFDANAIKTTNAEAIDAWLRLNKGEQVSADRAMRVYDLLKSEGHSENPGVGKGGKGQLNRVAEQRDPPMVSLEELRHEYGLLAQGTWDKVLQLEPNDVLYIKKVMENGHNVLDEPNVHISTIHRVKGGQADTVVLLSDAAKASEKYFMTNQDEETRVFYTGVTRTYENLVIVQPSSRHHFERIFE